MQKIKTFFTNFHTSLLKNEVILDNRKHILSIVTFYLSAFVVFMTLMSQMPALSSRGLTKIFQVGWVVVLIPMIMLDYRHILRCAANCLIILVPFLIYCIIAYFCGIQSIKYSGTTCIFLAIFMVTIGSFYGKYFNFNFLRGIAIAYILGAAIYAGVVYLNKLRGYDINNPIYAFDDKNSAGPIFLTAALLAFIVFKKKSVISYIFEILIFVFFATIIVLAKCRATVVFLPIALLLIHLFLPTNRKSKLISRIAFPSFLIMCVLLIFFIDPLYQKIIVNIIMNGKKTIDEAFAGRIEQIKYLVQHLQLGLGNGGYYIDCMPISFLATYGIVGLISMLPVAILPFYTIIKGRKIFNKTFFIIEITILSLLAFNSLLEGYGYFGPGTKVFMLWMLTGYSYYHVAVTNKDLIYQLADKPAQLCHKLKPKPFLIAFQILIIAGSGALIYSKTLSNKLGTTYVDLLPQNNKKSDYISVTDMDISKETRDYLAKAGGLCTGQKIKFKHSLEPNNATDYWANWLPAWVNPEAIKVDISTGVVEAISTEATRTIVQVFFPTCGNDSRYIEFPINKPEDFEFKNGLIDIKPFEYSFNISEEGKKGISINTNQTIKFYYDTNYIPIKVKEDYFTFEISKGESTATIDSSTGVFKARAAGEYKVRGKITNLKGTYYTNEIDIKVNNAEFVPVDSINFDDVEKIKNNAYENQPIEIKPKWTDEDGKEPTDKEFDIIVEKADKNYVIDEQKHTITFKQSGEAKITLQSRNDPNKKSETISLEVKKNPLVKFSCNDDWILIGEIQDIEKIGLYLEYENGYKKLVEEKDLLVTDRRFGRSGDGRTGFINGTITTIKGMGTGGFSYTYVAKENPSIKYDLNLVSSVFTKAEYYAKVNNSGMVMIFMIVSAVTPFLLFVDIKRKWVYLILASSYGLSIIGLTFFTYSYNAYSMSCLIAFISIIFLFSLIRFVLFENKAIQFVDKE